MDNRLGVTNGEIIWLVHLFLLPYYKYLLKQPGLFYQSADDEWLQIEIEYGMFPIVPEAKSQEKKEVIEKDANENL